MDSLLSPTFYSALHLDHVKHLRARGLPGLTPCHSLQGTHHALIPSSLCTYQFFCPKHLSPSVGPSKAFHAWISAQWPLLWESLLKVLAVLTSDLGRDDPPPCSVALGAALIWGLQLQALGGRVCASIQLPLSHVTMHPLHVGHWTGLLEHRGKPNRCVSAFAGLVAWWGKQANAQDHTDGRWQQRGGQGL